MFALPCRAVFAILLLLLLIFIRSVFRSFVVFELFMLLLLLFFLLMCFTLMWSFMLLFWLFSRLLFSRIDELLSCKLLKFSLKLGASFSLLLEAICR